MVNVLNPTTNKTSVDETAMTVTDNQITLPLETIASSVAVSGKTVNTDYSVFYTDEACVIEFVEDTETATVTYDKVNTTDITKADIIGGVDTTTKRVTGLSLIEQVFPKYGIVPDLVICPGWSSDAEVAAVMSAKAEEINGLFEATAIIDVDTGATDGATSYTDVPTWKKEKNISGDNELLCWPLLKLSERVFHFSTQQACLMSSVDNDSDYGNGTPCESASNKLLQADSMVLEDETEVVLDYTQANYLNSNGIVTALNFIDGFVSWGDWMANYPASTDPTEYFYNESRMFKFVAATVILSYWKYTDRNMKRRLADAILQGINDWLAGLTHDESIYGGRVELNDGENTTSNLCAGKLGFRIHLGTEPPMVWQQYDIEYDSAYITAAFS